MNRCMTVFQQKNDSVKKKTFTNNKNLDNILSCVKLFGGATKCQ